MTKKKIATKKVATTSARSKVQKKNVQQSKTSTKFGVGIIFLFALLFLAMAIVCYIY